MILERRTQRLVLTHKDRLLRFGAELVFTLCELRGIEVVVIHQGEQPASRRTGPGRSGDNHGLFGPPLRQPQQEAPEVAGHFSGGGG